MEISLGSALMNSLTYIVDVLIGMYVHNLTSAAERSYSLSHMDSKDDFL